MVILSDGCSSTQHTDIGSRILVHSLLASPDINQALTKAQNVCINLNLPLECLATTILTLTAENDDIYFNMIGDGCCISRKRYSGELEFFNFEFESGAPYYLLYELADKVNYIKEFGQKFKINGIIQEENLLDVYPMGLVCKKFPITEYDLVAIFSDGVNSFQQIKDNKTLPISRETIANELLSIKGFAGSFVQRRCQKAFATFDRLGYRHYDDFSMGVIKIGESHN